jgi:predicted TIM-barrel fold metal-dependent hydrolase
MQRYEVAAREHPDNAELLAWFAKEVHEEIIEPGLPIIDAHHHLWDHGRDGFWRQKAYLIDDILRDVNCGHNIISTVYVQAGSFHRSFGPAELMPLGEVEYCQGMAALSDSGNYGHCRVNAAIVGTVDLRHPNAETVLGEMMKCRNFRGIRTSARKPDRAMAMSPPLDFEFVRGFRLLEKHGLSYDWWSSKWETLPLLKAIALQFPTVPIVSLPVIGKLIFNFILGLSVSITDYFK